MVSLRRRFSPVLAQIFRTCSFPVLGEESAKGCNQYLIRVFYIPAVMRIPGNAFAIVKKGSKGDSEENSREEDREKVSSITKLIIMIIKRGGGYWQECYLCLHIGEQSSE